MEKGRSRPVGRVGREFLLVAKGDDRDRLGTGHLAPEGLPEETADQFEVLHEVAPAVFAGGGKELEVGGLNAQPRIVRRGPRSGSQCGDQKRGTRHDEGCSTGSAEPSSMCATSACSRSGRSTPERHTALE